MGIATVLGCFAWYVIHTNKDLAGKAHLLTLHGKLGAAVIIAYIGIGIFGAVALHPKWGILKTNKTLRLVHKLAGRATTWLAWTSCVLGFATFRNHGYGVETALFTLPLLLFGYYALL